MFNYERFLMYEAYLSLNEALIKYSDNFIDRIREIKSPVATFLLEIMDTDSDIRQNFIDITSDDDKISFIDQKKLDAINGRGIEIDPFNTKQRSVLKIGRLVKSLAILFEKDFKDSDIEYFVNQFKSKTISGEVFELVSGDQIPHWYSEDTHSKKHFGGSLGNSCMSGCPDSYFDIYTYSKSCQLLILTDNGELLGRALVWKLKDKPEGFPDYFMDRVYTFNDSDVNKFHDYAAKQNWIRKKYNSYDSENGGKFILKDKEMNGRISAIIKEPDDNYPYLDTLKFIDKHNNEISNLGYFGGGVLSDTEGEREICYDCDAVGYYNCFNCRRNGLDSECASCEGSGKILCGDCTGVFETDIKIPE